MQHEDYKKQEKLRPQDIKMQIELPETELDMELELEEPKRKTHKNGKAKIVEIGMTKKQGGLF